MKYLHGLLLALLMAAPHLSHAATRCSTDAFGNTICKESGVDLSRIGLEGIDAFHRNEESQERVRASELRREKELFELERERQRWRIEQEALELEQAKRNRKLDDENIMLCKKYSSEKITCQDNKGKIMQYQADME